MRTHQMRSAVAGQEALFDHTELLVRGPALTALNPSENLRTQTTPRIVVGHMPHSHTGVRSCRAILGAAESRDGSICSTVSLLMDSNLLKKHHSGVIWDNDSKAKADL